MKTALVWALLIVASYAAVALVLLTIFTLYDWAS